MEIHPDSSKSSVLVIDRNDARADHLKTVLNVLEVGSVVARPQQWRDQVVELEAILAIIVGYDTVGEVTQTLSDVHEWNPKVPVCLMDYDELSNELPQQVYQNILRNLSYPVRYFQLKEVLSEAQGVGGLDTRRTTRRDPELFRLLSGNSPVNPRTFTTDLWNWCRMSCWMPGLFIRRSRSKDARIMEERGLV